MATTKLSVYALGVSGVIIDPNPLEPTLPADTLVLAQNVIHDPKSGHGGGLRNRDGLARFNTSPLGDVVLGGAPMIVAGTAGAPAPSPTPGLPTDGDPSVPGGTPGTPVDPLDPGGDPGTPTGFPTTPGTRTLIIGRRLNSMTSAPSDGWFVSQSRVAITPVMVATPGPPGAAARGVPAAGTWSSSPGCAVAGGFLYYPAWQSWAASGSAGAVGGTFVYPAPGVVSPVLRRTDGVTDDVVCTVPKSAVLDDQYFLSPTTYNPDFGYGNWGISHPLRGDSVQPAIVSMIAVNDNTIFFSVCDRGSGFGGEIAASPPGFDVARMFRYDIPTHTTTEVPLVLDGEFNMLPYALAWWNNRLYFGGYSANIGGSLIWKVDPGAELPSVVLSVPELFRVTAFASLGDDLFIGFQARTTPSNPTLVVTPIYRYHVDGSMVSLPLSGVGAAVESNGVVSFVAFGGALYASYVNPGVAAGGTFASHIYRYDPSTDAWVSVYSGAADYVLRLVVDGSVLYAYGTSYFTSGYLMISTVDGTTWIDHTAAMTAGGASGLNQVMTGVLFGFDS